MTRKIKTLPDSGERIQRPLYGDPAEVQALMQDYLRAHEHRSSQDILSIAQDITALRQTLREGRAVNTQALPEVGAELQAVLRDTEAATHIILDASESLLNLSADLPDLKVRADELVMRIFEACSFQDLVGQRISKIVRLMESIEDRVSESEAALHPQKAHDPLLNGPALNGPEVSQAMIDQMLSEF